MKRFLFHFLKIKRLEFLGIKNPTFYFPDGLRKRIIPSVVIGAVLSLFLIQIVVFKVNPTYVAESLLNIEPHLPRVLYNTDTSKYLHSYEDWLRTQVGIIRSIPLLKKAIEINDSYGIKWSLPGESSQSSIFRLNANLKVNQIRETQLISISIESKNKEGLDTIVNSVVDSYIDFELDREKKIDTFKLEYLKKEQEETEIALEKAYAELESLSRYYGTAISEDKNMYVYIEVLDDLEKSHNRLVVSKIELQNLINSLKEKKRELEDTKFFIQAEDSLKMDQGLLQQEKLSLQEEQELRQKLLTMKDANPDKKELTAKIERIRKSYDETYNNTYNKEENFQKNKAISLIDKEILDSRTNLTAVTKSERDIIAEMKKAELKLVEYSTAVSRANTKKNEIERLKDRLAKINQRMDEVNIELNMPSRISIVSRALPPETSENSKIFTMIFISIIGCIIFGFIITTIIEFLDPTLKKLEDVRNTLGFSATGYISDLSIDVRNRNKNHLQLISSSPEPYLIKEIKQIGTFLEKEIEDNHSKVFCFLNINQHSDDNFISSTIIKSLDYDPKKKLLLDQTENLTSNTNYIDYQKESIYNDENFKNKIQKSKKKFDLIFINSPNLYTSSESHKYIIHSDVVVLIVDAGETTWQQLKDTVDYINRLKVKALSIILNKVDANSDPRTIRIMNEYYKNI